MSTRVKGFHDKLQKANTGWKIEDEERGNSTILYTVNWELMKYLRWSRDRYQDWGGIE